MSKPRKPKICKNCKESFIPERSFQNTCGFDCAMAHARKKTETNKKTVKNKAIKEFREKDKSWLMKIAQQTFNKYIRLRDGNICITCGNTERQIHAGHFRPVGRNSKLRFNPINCHSQCSICNNHLSGNLVPYREAMVLKYGEEEVEKLESDNAPYKYTVEELKEIIERFKELTKKAE